jgi:hypothetical protein
MALKPVGLRRAARTGSADIAASIATAADAARRPHVISEATWEAIPERYRQAALARAAVDLTKCIHPEDSVRRFLAENGLPSPRRTLSAAVRRQAPPGPAPTPAAQAATPMAARPSLLSKLSRRPAQSAPTTFRSRIGPAIAAAGVALDDAGRMEGMLLSAIRRWPEIAFSDPECLAFLGRGLSVRILVDASDVIREEAGKEIDDRRRRKAAGDPELDDWIDPDGWSFGLDDEPGHCAPRP